LLSSIKIVITSDEPKEGCICGKYLLVKLLQSGGDLMKSKFVTSRSLKSPSFVFKALFTDFKPLISKGYIDFLSRTNREKLSQFIEHADTHHPTIKFTADISNTDNTFLHTSVYTGKKFKCESVLDICNHYKPTATFQYTYFSCVTHQELRKVSLKERPSDCLEKIPLNQHLRKKSNTSDHISLGKVTQTTSPENSLRSDFSKPKAGQ